MSDLAHIKHFPDRLIIRVFKVIYGRYSTSKSILCHLHAAAWCRGPKHVPEMDGILQDVLEPQQNMLFELLSTFAVSKDE
ncbi:hypothetical protein CEXT_714221 [Caerostris extrusa]|uniref:Uncharacterized protein n=1 Tax=Caerostris extrusa TaxID=172846 RepID=A0AAV4N5C0_CAEEX|nr:hypothetical protein CEXT_714221 [Caerostris extrusa]